MRKLLLILIFSISQVFAQTIVFTDQAEKSNEVMKFEVQRDGVDYSICKNSNYDSCQEIGFISNDSLNGIIERKKKGIRNMVGGVAISVASGALLFYAMQAGNDVVSIASFIGGMIGVVCGPIPFATFLKNEQYGFSEQTQELLELQSSCRVGETKVDKTYNFNIFKRNFEQLAE